MLKVNFKDFIPERTDGKKYPKARTDEESIDDVMKRVSRESTGCSDTPAYEDLSVLMEKVNVFLSESENIAETIPFSSDFNLINVETIKVSMKYSDVPVSGFRVFYSENKEVTSYREHLIANKEVVD